MLAVALAVAVVPAGRAQAEGTGQLAWDDDGSTFAVFGANESVSIGLGTVGFFCDSFFPTADVYVMASPPASGATLTDVNGVPNTVFGGTGGIFSDTIAFTAPSGNLSPGTYTVVYDECQDGRLSADDSVFLNAFEVRQATDVPAIDGAIAGLKLGAGATAKQYETLSDVLAGYQQAQALQEALACLLGPLDCLVSTLTDTMTDAIIEQIKLGLGLPTEDPKVLALDVLADNIRHYKGIEADPPDASFALTTTLDPVRRLHPDDSDPRTLARFDLANAHAEEAALASALLHAIERYQGADSARAGAWARLHARQARDLAGLLAEQLKLTNSALTSLSSAVVADTGDLDRVANTASEALSELASSGLTADTQRGLINLGFSRAEIASAAANLDNPLAGFSRAGLRAAIDQTITANTRLADALEVTRTGMGAILARLASDPTVPRDTYPVVDAGEPYAASAGATVTLAGVVSAAGEAASAAAWDLDRDGQFDDATGLTPAVTFPGALDGLIGLRVTDGQGHVSVDYVRVLIDGDGPPRATFSPSGFTREVQIGATSAFRAAASDPDQDDVDISWRLDGEAVATGAAYDFAATAANTGLHVLEASVTDGRNTISHRWALAAVRPDADGDGWRANLDCDDASAVRNPGLAEIGGNGVDDDCEPLTLDDQPLIDANLVANPGAETGTAVPSGGLVAVPGWQTSGAFTIVSYADTANTTFPRSSSPGPADRGAQFFAGGPPSAGSPLINTARQTIDLARSSTPIDAGEVTFDLAAFIGGFQGQGDRGTVTATFLTAADATLEVATIGPVTEIDRGNTTGLLPRAVAGAVPPGSRKVRVEMSAQRLAGVYNDGYFDNLRLVLHGPGFDVAAPVLDPEGDLVVAEGATGSISVRAGAGDPVTLTASGVPSFASFTDHGDGTATLRASPPDDADAAVVVSACSIGGCQRRLIRVRGVNVAPTASATSNGPVAENSSARITAAKQDPGADTFTYAFDCDGDGTFASFQGTNTTDCPFAVRGAHDVGVRVRDDDGGVGSTSTNVFVTPRIAPVAEIARVDSAAEGAYIRLDGRASTGTNDAPLAFAWRQTGGPPVTLSSAAVTRPSFTAPDDGQYRFTLVVTAGQAASAPDEVTITVTNVAPRAEVTNDGPVGTGRPVHITVKASDPGTGDSFVYAFDCEGDGTFGSDIDVPSGACVFGGPGSHVVRVRVTDDDGGVGQSQTTVSVTAGAPTVTLTAPADASVLGDATPALEGVAGVAAGDAASVRVRIHAGASTSGALNQTRTATRDPSTGAYAVDADTLADGTYTAQAEQADSAGNTGRSSATTFRIDTGAPAVTLTEPANGSSTVDATPVLEGMAGVAAGDAASVRVRIHAGASTSGALNQTRTATRDPSTGAYAVDADTLADGTYTAQAEQADSAGNTGRSSATTFRIATSARTVVVADRSAFGGSGGVIRVNPLTGARTTVSRNSSPTGSTAFVDPTSIAAAAGGTLVVADPSAFGGSGGVIRVNPLTGARTTVSRNSSPTGSTAFVNPTSIVVEANGNILIADPSAFGGSGGVIRVNPVTGARTTVSRNSSPTGSTAFADPVDVAVEANGSILVADLSAFGGSGGVIRIDPVTGARTKVSSNSAPAGATAFADPTSLVVEDNGSIVVADLAAFGGAGGAIRIHPQTGARTTLSRNMSPTGSTAFADPSGIAVETGGGILVSDSSAFGGTGGVIRVNPQTGARTSVSRNSNPTGSTAFVDPTGLVVEPAP